MHHVEIYDTTLRDGAQSEGVSFSVHDKLLITQKLDILGIHYIEGGWPGTNPKDDLYFEEVKKLHLKSAKPVAFGATRRANNRASDDPNLKALIAADTEVVTIFGKSWDFHVTEVLGVSLKKNLEMIADSVSYLRSKGKRVFFDAEHFFDGFLASPGYAIKTLQAAESAGAACLILCDTNGGTMPWQVEDVCRRVLEGVDKASVGIHTHNDGDVAVANALTAVRVGATQVQGTINGFGERCGNVNLCSVIAALNLKMNHKCIGSDQLKHLRAVSQFVSEVANLPHVKNQPYVGESAFAHKGGVHVHAVQKASASYEHVPPQKVGNRQRVLVSDYSGTRTLLEKAQLYGIALPAEAARALLKAVKEKEHQGYQFEGAEASFELMMKKATHQYKPSFDLIRFRVVVEKGAEHDRTEATVEVKVNGRIQHTAAVGNGPVNALDQALRRALIKFYPVLSEVKLIDYKVRVLTASDGTEAKVRVLIESGDGRRTWQTVGVSHNVIEASWQALVDSIDYKLNAF